MNLRPYGDASDKFRQFLGMQAQRVEKKGVPPLQKQAGDALQDSILGPLHRCGTHAPR